MVKKNGRWKGLGMHHVHAIVITYFVLLILFLLIKNMQISSKRKYTMSLASFPGPRPASRHLQYGKAGEGLVHFLT